MKDRRLFFSWIIITVLLAIIINDRYLKFAEIGSSNLEKIEEVLELTNMYYVDTVDWDKTVAKGIEGMLQSLDPHSVYFDISEAASNDESFEGKYQGIGIQYDVIDGYINVISVIPGSPSEKVGLYAGDIIVEIDGKSAFGLTNADVPRKLKGEKGTKVTVGVSRSGFEELIDFEITRDEIPIFTINTSFMADDSTGYIWINRFASTTADEFETALIKLEKSGMKQLVVDLRNNGGGYLSQAVKIVGKFISGNKKVVYTKGRIDAFNEAHFSDDYGKSIDRDYPLVILINGSSASASEIVSGAIQDYDRGFIVGTQSFGKGLVQNEFELNDNSRLRLTISKYYTPSGRLIQKPYRDKTIADYYNHTQSDTLSNADSTEKAIYYTTNGRIVYGGGGITPDSIVEYSSFSKAPKLTQKLFEKRLFFEVAAQYSNENMDSFSSADEYIKNFEVKDLLMRQMKKAAEAKGISFPDSIWASDDQYLRNRLKAEIARAHWSQNEFWRVILQNDNQFSEALKMFGNARDIVAFLEEIEPKID